MSLLDDFYGVADGYYTGSAAFNRVEEALKKKDKKSSMYLEDTSGMSPRQIRDKVNGFRKD